jgi:hypothetical protein
MTVLCAHLDERDCVSSKLAHAQKSDFVFRRNGRVYLNRRGRQFNRLLAAEVCASAVVMLDTPCSEVVWRVLATHSIRQFPLHIPSSASPCAITFQLVPTTVEFGFFHVIHTTASDDFATQLSPIGLSDVNPPCSLLGMNCVIICTWCRLILMIEGVFKTFAPIQSQGPINPKAGKECTNNNNTWTAFTLTSVPRSRFLVRAYSDCTLDFTL